VTIYSRRWTGDGDINQGTTLGSLPFRLTPFTRRRPGVLMSVACGIASVALVLVGEPAYAAATAPTVTSFKAAPSSLSNAGGVVVLKANVTNASTCGFAANPPVSGLPVTLPCAGGAAKTTVAFPANATTTPETYVITLTVTGSGTVTVNKVVTVGTAAPVPTITSISPAKGPPLGNMVVTVRGTDLSTVASVNFGTLSATVMAVRSDDQITVAEPGNSAPSTADIVVTLADGSRSAIVPADLFKWVTGSGPFPKTISVDGSGQQSIVSEPCGSIGCTPLSAPQLTWSGTFTMTYGSCPNTAALTGAHPAACYLATGSGTGTTSEYDANGAVSCTKPITWSLSLPPNGDGGAWIQPDSAGVYHLYYDLGTDNWTTNPNPCSPNTQFSYPGVSVELQHLLPNSGFGNDTMAPDTYKLGQTTLSPSGQATTGDGSTGPGFKASATFTFGF